jgi:NAD+ synthase (glutamine-hydrolysing)
MLRVALAQINTTVGNLEGNYRKAVEYIGRAREIAADIVVFPEMTITGYPPEDLLYKDYFVRDNIRFLKELIKKTGNIAAIIGFVDKDQEGSLYNAAAIIHNKVLKGVYRKQNLPNYSVFDEKRYFVSGKDIPVFSFGENIIGISICEDIWIDGGPCHRQLEAGANILINISSSPYHIRKGQQREKLIKARARKNNTFICYANLVGGQDELIFDGASMIVDPKGRMIASGRYFEEDFIVADLMDDTKTRFKKQKHVRLINVPKKSVKDSRLFIRGKVENSLELVEEVYRALILGTRDYVQKNGFKKVVVGLSGGIDSSLVAVIAAHAIGQENVVGITMPSQFSSSGTLSDAKQLGKTLGIKIIEIPIKPVFDSYLQSLSFELGDRAFGIAQENLQARIRGNILMAFSNQYGWLVLTTGNKSEFAVGYCTLYGDMSGGFAVIKDVKKTQVYDIANFINEKYKNVIPLSVISRPPTAELRENQKDEDSLPPYDVLDPLLKSYVEEHRSIAQMAKTNDKDLIRKVVDMVDRSEYKRRQAPPGIKVSSRAFGKDWRLPVTNKYKEA